MGRERDFETGRWAVVHGQRKTPEYACWAHMMQRCYDPNDRKFEIYGGRGIVVCDRWHDSANFLADMGKRPSRRHTLGRIDNDGNYEQSNCRWEMPAEQSRNRSTTKLTWAKVHEIRMLSNRGYSQNDLAREFGVTQANIWSVIHHQSWREDITPLPPRNHRRKKA
jgi:hypothetical protein